MNHRNIREDDILSEPDSGKELAQDYTDDVKSLWHWKEDDSQIEDIREPNLFLENLSSLQRFNAVMLCKKIGIQCMFSNFNVEHLSNNWFIDDEMAEDWEMLLAMIFRGVCGYLQIKGIDVLTFQAISKSLGRIQFLHLTELNFNSVRLDNLEVLSFLNAPFLFCLKIEQCNLANTKALQKTNFTKIKYFFCQIRSLTMKNHFIQRFEMMERMRICQQEFKCNHTKANFLLLGIYNEATDFLFQIKMESNSAILNMDTNFKQEINTSINNMAQQFRGDQQREFAVKWKKNYALVVRKCQNILMRCDTVDEPAVRFLAD